jgi:threonine/homoserine/homoserine lactone efflux protein
MLAADQLAAFLLAACLIELTPGPNMGYLALVASRLGRGPGMVTVAGVTVGLAVYLAASVLGLTELTLRWPWVYEVLRWAGVAYLGWLAFDTWRAPRHDAHLPDERGLFVRGLVNNLLNPKAVALYVALLPGFVRPELGHPTAQVLALGSLHIAISLMVHTTIVWTAAAARRRLELGTKAWFEGRSLWAWRWSPCGWRHLRDGEPERLLSTPPRQQGITAVKWLMAIIVTTLPAPGPTHPAFFEATRLQAVCADEGPEAASAKVFCMGYVMGVADLLLTRPLRRGGPTICPPADFKGKDAVEAVHRSDRYATKGQPAAEFVRFALERAYPCPVQRDGG